MNLLWPNACYRLEVIPCIAENMQLSLCLSVAPWNIWRSGSIAPRIINLYVEVTDQAHVSATLTEGKDLPVPIG